MYDAYQRRIDYLRISITDRCNLRCIYCMPEEGIQMTAHEEILTYDEIIRVCRIAAAAGIKKIKITGGEPLVRKGAPQLVETIKGIAGIENVTMTTNGILLGDAIAQLAEAEIDGINISLDTLNRELFQRITRFDKLEMVRESIQKVLGFKDISLKINCVPMNLPDQELIDIAALARSNKIHVRFIEMMPIGFGKQFEFVSEAEIVKRLAAAFGSLTPYQGKLGNGPCHYYQIDGFKGKIGFISALSHQFCESCNRVRLTSQGFLKTCLQYETGVDLKPLLRGQADDQELLAAFQKGIQSKPKGHEFLTRQFIDQNENRLIMSRIGG